MKKRKPQLRPSLRRLTPEQVVRIRSPNANATDLSREFGVSFRAVWKIKWGITYRDLPFDIEIAALKKRRPSAVCEKCGVTFERRPSAMTISLHHYCSKACKIAAQKREGHSRWKGIRVQIICEGCGTPFNRAEPGNRFCSKKCYGRFKAIYLSKKEQQQASARRRRIREQGRIIVGGRHTEAEWFALVERAKGRCVICKKKRRLTRDHIIPISKSGSDEITNIQPLCASCNSRKNDRRINLL